MSFLVLLAFAIMIAFCTFGLNQIIIMSTDVKYIKSVVKDLIPQEKKERTNEVKETETTKNDETSK